MKISVPSKPKCVFRQIKRMLILNHFWYTLCFAILIVFVNEVLKLRSNKPNYEHSLLKRDAYPILVVCLRLDLESDKCEHLNEKLDFNCEMKYQLKCYTKGFEHLKRSYVIKRVGECELEKQILVYNNHSSIRPTYTIYEDQICLKFDHINFSTIDPITKYYQFQFYSQSKHDYYIYLLHTKRQLPKKYLFHRKCVLNKTNDDFYCRQPLIKIDYAKVKRKKLTGKMANCANYGEDLYLEEYENQHECLFNCYKKHSHPSLKQKRKCREKVCPLADCEENHFFLDTITKSETEFNYVNVNCLMHHTEIINWLENDDLFLHIVGILSSLFGFNILYQSLTFQSALHLFLHSIIIQNFKEHHHPKMICLLNRYSKYVKFSFILITAAACSYQLCGSIMKYAKFEEKHSLIYDFNKDIDNSITVSVCFCIKDIFLSNSKCDSTNFDECTLSELSNSTMKANELIKSAFLSSTVREKKAKIDENKWFFKDNDKCYDLNFRLKETKLDIFLKQSQIKIGTNRHFKHIYIRKEGDHPTFRMLKQLNKNFVIYSFKSCVENGLFSEPKCKEYEFEKDNCKSQQSCIENCVKDEYLRKHQNALSSEFIITRSEIERNETISALKLQSKANQTELDEIKKDCISKFLDDCEKTVFSTFNVSYQVRMRNLEDNLECEFQVYIIPKVENTFVKFKFQYIIYQFINISSLWFGFSLSALVNFIFKLIYAFRFKALTKILKTLATVFIFIIFIVHLNFFVDLIIKNEKVQMMYLLESKSNFLPRISLCLRYSDFLNSSSTSLTPNEIDKRTTSIEQLVDRLIFYDSFMNQIIIDKNNVTSYLYDKNDYLTYDTYHYQLANVFDSDLQEMFKIQTWFTHENKCFEIIITYKYNLLNYRLHNNPPLFHLKINQNLESILILLNDFKTLNLENWNLLYRDHNMELNYKRLKTLYNNDLYYLKHPQDLIWSREYLDQFSYFENLHLKFYLTFNRTTTLLPLTNASYYNIEIDNQLFKEFYSNQSKDEQDLSKYQKLPAHFEENQIFDPIKIIDKGEETIFKIYPYFLKYSLVVSSKLTICTLLLYITLIFTLYFNVSFVQLPFFIFKNFKITCSLLKRSRYWFLSCFYEF